MRWVYIFLGFWAALLIVGFSLSPSLPAAAEPNLGVSFTASQAWALELDWRQVYTDILDELQVTNLRLQVNWSEIEPQPGEFFFDDIDWQIAEARKRGAQVTLAVGRKLPRWPECHVPAWAKTLTPWEEQERVLQMLEATIKHFKDNPTIVRWQLENEPLFQFGDCPKPNKHFLTEELKLVKSLDSRPVLITDTGELSMWWETEALADVQGATLYQTTWNPWFGYFNYPVPAWFYHWKAGLISRAVQYTIISELQMEPWGPAGLEKLTLGEAARSFTVKNFKDNIEFFKKTGLAEAYLWGVEWWYKAKTLGDDSLWQEAKTLW